MKKLKKYKKIILLCFFFSVFFLGGISAKAASPAYYITPIFSEHQTKAVTTFFDLRWTPNKSDKVGITITNNTDKDKNFEVNVNKARTNSNGVVNYTDSSKESLKSEQPTITSMVDFPDSVTVPAHQSQTVYSTINFPENDFNGIKMAGVVVKEKGTNTKSQNVISYALPLIIRGNIDQRPTSEITFGKFDLKQNNFHTFALKLPISNEKETLLKDTQVQVKIINSANSTVWKKNAKFLMTPETSFTYNQAINKRLDAGKYKVQLIVRHAGNVWKSTQNLTISAQKAKKIAKTVPKGSLFSYLKKPIVLVIVTILGTLLVIALSIAIWSYTKKGKSSNN
ncbi:DUF916 domain-containing protein [Lactococcus lactis]|uniref:DUF916 domain-containing protein n=1 Tax=Lactococcus lactis TaxID=1358 RepID=UPI0038779524